MDLAKKQIRVRGYDARMTIPLSWDQGDVIECAFVTRVFIKGEPVDQLPTHSGASNVVAVFKDASKRTVEAFHAKYNFADNFNTSVTDDPRPDLTAEGVIYQ